MDDKSKKRKLNYNDLEPPKKKTYYYDGIFNGYIDDYETEYQTDSETDSDDEKELITIDKKIFKVYSLQSV
jgi:hypothetical protein